MGVGKNLPLKDRNAVIAIIDKIFSTEPSLVDSSNWHVDLSVYDFSYTIDLVILLQLMIYLGEKDVCSGSLIDIYVVRQSCTYHNLHWP